MYPISFIEERIEKWKKKPISWSSISQFKEYSKEQWFKSYVLGEKTPENIYMTFGKEVGENLQKPDYLPEVERPDGGVYEYKLLFKVKEKEVIGFIDFFHKDKLLLKEFKTGKVWDKERAEQHGQLKIYALGLLLQDNIKPEQLDIHLVSLETARRGYTIEFVPRMKPLTFQVKLTTENCLKFGDEIINIIKEMEEYVNSKCDIKL